MTGRFILICIVGLFLLSPALPVAALEPIQIAPPKLTPPAPYPPGPPAVTARAAGTIKKGGTTSYMYGTHVLTGTKTYALKSDTINLDLYIGKKVTVSGRLIPGYPLSGGPEYMNVDSVTENGR